MNQFEDFEIDRARRHLGHMSTFGRYSKSQWVKEVAKGLGNYVAGRFSQGSSSKSKKKYKHASASTSSKNRLRARSKKIRKKTGPPSAGTIVEPQGNSKGYTKLPTGKSWIAKNVLEALANNHYTVNAGSQLTCGVGVQSATYYSLGSTASLNTLATKVQVGTLSTAEQMFLQSMTNNLQIRSASTYTSNVIIYDVVPRRDLYSAVIGDPLTAWSTGIVDELSTGLYTDVGNTPIQSDLFNQFFKIVNTHKVEILPGGTYTHSVYSEPNIKLHSEVTSRVTSGLRNLTVFSMVVVSGGPAHDSTTKSQVTSSATALDIIQTVTYNVKYLLDNTTSYFRSNNLVSAFTVGPEVVNEELGELQNAAGITGTIGAY